MHLWFSCGVRIAQSYVFCVVYYNSLFVLLSLSSSHCWLS
jgi:hypothetical protein